MEWTTIFPIILPYCLVPDYLWLPHTLRFREVSRGLMISVVNDGVVQGDGREGVAAMPGIFSIYT